MKTTIEYFGKTLEEMLVTNEHGYTKEENLLFDDGEKVVFFDSEAELESEKEEFNNYVQSGRYEVKTTLKTINERIAVVLV